ncbi:MAG: GNA1162 family protein [Elusimicrobiota bacterium]
MSGRRSASVLLLAALAGCGHKAVRYAAADLPARMPASVAVMPFDNLSTDVDAPKVVRGVVERDLAATGLSVRPVEGTDEALRAIGVTDGGQLKAYAPADLARAVGADGLLYGSVESFQIQNLGVYVRRTVVVRLTLVEGASGEKLWEAEGKGSSQSFARPQHAGREFVRELVQDALSKMTGKVLAAEAEKAVFAALAEMPRRY